MLNRSALIVRPTSHLIEWARQLDPSGSLPSADGEQTVYLVPDMLGMDEDAVLRMVWAEVFERQLLEWNVDESTWPDGRDLAMFKAWFHWELHSVVEDLCAEPLEDDDDWAGGD